MFIEVLIHVYLLFLGKKSILHIYSGLHVYSEGESKQSLKFKHFLDPISKQGRDQSV